MIQSILGPNGSGKGVGASHLVVLPSWRHGRPVVANYRLYPERCGFPADLYRPLESWTEITRLGVQCWHCRRLGRIASVEDKDHREAAFVHARALEGGPCPDAELSVTENRPCTLILDEITSVLPSRGSSDMPVELQRMLHQFRKPDVSFTWMAVAWARCDLIAREATMRVIECSPVAAWLTAKRAPGTAWVEHRVFRFEAYDAYEYNEADETGRLDGLRPQRTKHLWRPEARRLAQRVYDTKEGVALLDNVQCAECGGRLPKKVCKGDHGRDTRTGTRTRMA